MTSTNEELPPPPKPRASPFDYRNTDLVSRLLAATPPYLYNMPLIPHSFFFSEMLRSLVQAKTENANRNITTPHLHQRRSRKRSWTQVNADYYLNKDHAKIEKPDMPPPTSWLGKTDNTDNTYTNKVERPLELTTDKLVHSSNNNLKINLEDNHHDNKHIYHQSIENPLNNTSKQDQQQMKHNIQYPFPPTPQPSNASDIVLPPPPPVWYPALYPTPYGIDPLHFFIDLRVSGHIYDRKNQRGSPISPQTTTSASSPSINKNSPQDTNTNEMTYSESLQDPFRQTRHSSAFSVPSSRLAKNIPMNLSNYQQTRKNIETKMEIKENGHTKFDVKSLGFEKSSNKLGCNYVMGNILQIYKQLHENEYKSEPKEVKQEEHRDTTETTTDTETNEKETLEEKEKRVKGLRALIGLELVVDYMNQAKPGDNSKISDDSSTDLDSSDSTTVDVVALQEDT
ncbi:hypothetical protein RN001_005281 [Aquatica leii]|uniref:Uncharacterized protein n=1 Tax=Aquatica leii TaxID=1421715 RepID=A0AAN7Q100_9COLE|nr:hypothetical protein RN001_005281 [Aquatica leii]